MIARARLSSSVVRLAVRPVAELTTDVLDLSVHVDHLDHPTAAGIEAPG